MYTVYVLKNDLSGKRYIGQTANLSKRVERHNQRHRGYTGQDGAWKAIHTEEYRTRGEAVARERFLKTGQGREFLKSLEI
jgi:putative endonuclease